MMNPLERIKNLLHKIIFSNKEVMITVYIIGYVVNTRNKVGGL